VWIRDAAGERQISGEGYAFFPQFSANGRRLVYRLAPDVATGQAPTELWATDLASGARERILPGRLVSSFYLSSDDRIVAAVQDADGISHLWLVRLDGREAPRQIPGVVGDNPRFGARDDIFFRGVEGDGMYLFRVDDKGEGKRKVSAERMTTIIGRVSPDGEWISALAGGDTRAMSLYSTTRAMNVPLFRRDGTSAVARVRWSPDGRRAYVSLQIGDQSAFGTGVTYVLPIAAGSQLPAVPAEGFATHEEIGRLPGVETLPFGDVMPGPTSDTYAYSRDVVTRNLYRIPLD
jgi:Tol biopolymer transport system component